MRNFSWKYFTLTGDVESFMLYKEMTQFGAEGDSAQFMQEYDEQSLMDMEDASS
jgi:hypothetical protein